MANLPHTPNMTGFSPDEPRSVERFPDTRGSIETRSTRQTLGQSISSLNVDSSAVRNSISNIGDSQLETIESLKMETERKDRLLEKLNAQLREREEQHDRDVAALSEMKELLGKKEEQLNELALAVSQTVEMQAENALTESLTLHGWDITDTGVEKLRSSTREEATNLSGSLDLTISTSHDPLKASASAETDALRQSIRKLQMQLTQRDRLHQDTELSNNHYKEEIQNLKDENMQYQALLTSQADEIQVLREQQVGETEELAALEEEISVLRTTLSEKLQIIETLTADANLSKTQLMQMKDAQRLVQHSADIATAEIETATEEITTLRMDLENSSQKLKELQAALDHEKFTSTQKTHEYTEVLTNLSHCRGVVSSLETQIYDMETRIKIKDEEIEALQLKCKAIQSELDDAHIQIRKLQANSSIVGPNLSSDELATILSDNNNMLNMLTESAAETETLIAANEKLHKTNTELTKINAELVAKIDQISMSAAEGLSSSQNSSQLLDTKNRIINDLELDLTSLRQKYLMMEKSLNEQLESVTVAKVSLEAENTRLRSELQNAEPPAMSSITSNTSVSIAGGHSPNHASSMSSQILNLNSDLVRLQTELRRKDAEIDNMSTQISAIMEEIVMARQSNMSLEQTVQSLTQEVEYHKSQATMLEKTLSQTREELRMTLDKTRVGELIEALNGKTTEVTKLIRVIEDKNLQIKDLQVELDGRSMATTTNKVMQTTIKNLEEEILRLNQELELVVISNESLESRLHGMSSNFVQNQSHHSEASRHLTSALPILGEQGRDPPSVSAAIKMRQLSEEIISLKDSITNLTHSLKQKDTRLEEVSSELLAKCSELDNMRMLIKKKNEQLMQFMK